MPRAAKLVSLLLFLLFVPLVLGPLALKGASGFPSGPQSSGPAPLTDPLGTSAAFNTSYSVYNTYTDADAKCGTPGNNANCNTGVFSRVSGDNEIKVSSSGGPFSDNISWTVPVYGRAGACSQCTVVIIRFVFFTPSSGTVDADASWNYTLYKSTTAAPALMQLTTQTGNGTIPASLHPNTLASYCATPDEVCYEATGSIGSNVTIAFRFAWGAGKTLSAQVGRILVMAPVSPNPLHAIAHQMALNPSNSNIVDHTANVTFSFNRTVTTPFPVTWQKANLTLYYPAAYTNFAATNQTGFLPSSATGTCTALDCIGFPVNTISYDLPQNAASFVITMTAQTPNTMTSISTVIGSLPADHWQPSESIGVKLNDTLSVPRPGTVSIIQTHSSGKTVGPTQTQATLGSAVFPVPAPTSPLGRWTLNATFTSDYDYGTKGTTVFIEHLTLAPGFNYYGNNSMITTSGTINDESTTVTSAGNIPVAVFGISTSTSGSYSKTFPVQTSGLYLRNITMVNGAFTSGQPLIMYLSIVNPSTATMVGNVTINHLFLPSSLGGSLHGVNATFSLDRPLDIPLQPGSRVYEVDVTLNNGQVNLKITTLRTGAQATATSGSGSSPIFDTRQQFGLFNIIITSRLETGGPTITNSVESQPFAYVFTRNLVASGGRILASSIGMTDSSGFFTVTCNSTSIAQARNLSIIALARDADGITLGNQDPTAARDKPIIIPTLEAPGEATPGQSVTVTLKLHNNSTRLGLNLNVTLQIFSGNGPIILTLPPRESGLIQPGQTRDLVFTFNAPSSLGGYNMSFFSAQYGAPIIATTLNVVVIPTWLAIMIPVIAGVAFGLILLLFYRKRKLVPVQETKPVDKARPPSPRTSPGSRNP